MLSLIPPVCASGTERASHRGQSRRFPLHCTSLARISNLSKCRRHCSSFCALVILRLSVKYACLSSPQANLSHLVHTTCMCMCASRDQRRDHSTYVRMVRFAPHRPHAGIFRASGHTSGSPVMARFVPASSSTICGAPLARWHALRATPHNHITSYT